MVLVIDDDPFAQKLLARQLAQLGVDDVRTCGSAPKALQMIDAVPAAYAALLVDLNMPGMDGVEFLRHLAQRHYRGGLILVSGEDERLLQSVAKLARAHRLRVLGSLHKPVSSEKLRHTLERLTIPGGSTQTGGAGRARDVDELREAIAGGRLINHYQPQAEFASGRVVGVEALVRWPHPDDGLIYPGQFVAVAEENGLAGELARDVLTRALRDARCWRDGGLDLRLSVNVSMDNLVALDFPDEVVDAAAAAGVPVAGLVLEVTESRLMTDPRALLDIATRLRLKRIGLSIDDFGTGFSSLAQLRDVPFDELKLDREFVHGSGDLESLRVILEANLGMARQLGLRTVAEGVEDRDDWRCLSALGCDLAQGWFVARPMPALDLPQWVRAWHARHWPHQGSVS